MRQIVKIIIHCADTSASMNIGRTEIEKWHKDRALGGIGREKEPWTPYRDKHGVERFIGYHKVIRRDGTTEIARPEGEIGCHTKGHNKDSLAICVVGGRNRMEFEPIQFQALTENVIAWLSQYNLKVENILGHHELDKKKACPNFSMDWFRSHVDHELKLRQEQGDTNGVS